MRYHFCTLFDKNYLYRGLALYNSLLRHCSNFKLWILCMDDTTYDILNKINLNKVELIPLKEFEDRELLNIKNTRTPGEYCFTCTPSLPLYILKKNPDLDMMAYLDADLYFSSSPEPIYKEFDNNSIMVVPHGFSKNMQYLEKFGVYNVGMLIFRNDKYGLSCLEWWRKRCIEWCFAYCDKGGFGDQGYLNDWPERFFGVHVLRHKGANTAPWNVSRYKIKKINNQIFVDDEPLIFYHFQSLKIYPNLKFQLYNPIYSISSNKRKLIYNPYLEELKKTIAKVKTIDPYFNYGLSQEPPILKRILLNNSKLVKLHLTFKKRIPIYRKFYKRINNL